MMTAGLRQAFMVQQLLLRQMVVVPDSEGD